MPAAKNLQKYTSSPSLHFKSIKSVRKLLTPALAMHIPLEKRSSSVGGAAAGVIIVVIIVIMIVFGAIVDSSKKTKVSVPTASSAVISSSTVIRSETVHSPLPNPSGAEECPPNYSQLSRAQDNLPSYTESRIHAVITFPERVFYRY